MRYCSLLLVLVPLVVFGNTSSQDDGKKDLKQFQGSWQAAALWDVNGLPTPENQVKDVRLVVEGNKFTLITKDHKIVGTFTLDPTRTPKTIDAIWPVDDQNQNKMLGIYEIRGDLRKSCFALPGKPRPTDFTAKEGYLGFEWKRN